MQSDNKRQAIAEDAATRKAARDAKRKALMIETAARAKLAHPLADLSGKEREASRSIAARRLALADLPDAQKRGRLLGRVTVAMPSAEAKRRGVFVKDDGRAVYCETAQDLESMAGVTVGRLFFRGKVTARMFQAASWLRGMSDGAQASGGSVSFVDERVDGGGVASSGSPALERAARCLSELRGGLACLGWGERAAVVVVVLADMGLRDAALAAWAAERRGVVRSSLAMGDGLDAAQLAGVGVSAAWTAALALAGDGVGVKARALQDRGRGMVSAGLDKVADYRGIA
jgi:hypothetical protein